MCGITISATSAPRPRPKIILRNIHVEFAFWGRVPAQDRQDRASYLPYLLPPHYVRMGRRTGGVCSRSTKGHDGMEHQQAQQIEQQLRRNWDQIRHRILDQFMETSRADLDAAVDVHDLVQRIADRTRHSERYVETRLHEMVGAAPGRGGMGSGQGGQQPFGSGQ